MLQESIMQNSLSDKIIQRSFLAVLFAQAFYLGTLVLKMPFSACAYFQFAGIVLVISGGILWDYFHRNKGKTVDKAGLYFRQYPCRTFLFLALIILQIVWNYGVRMPYIKGDITGEIMQSFLTADQIYSVNPMTGEEFLTGMPSRLKILGLPALYASVSKVTGLSVPFVCYRLIPAIVLLSGYLAYERLADFFFGEDKKAKLTFLIFVALVWQFGSYGLYNDSARLFLQGWRGESIRAVVLLPYALNCLLRKKYAGLVLTAFTELCVVWTLYGLGFTILMAAVFLIAGKVVAEK